MNDALIAVIVVVVAIIPVAFTINYAYSAIVTSTSITGQFNAFGDDFDQLIWDHMQFVNKDPGEPDTRDADKRLEDLPTPTPPQTFTIEFPTLSGPAATIDVEAVRFTQPLESVSRNVQAEVILIRRR